MRWRDLAAAAIGGLVCALAGGVAWATIPDSGGTVNGCFQKVHGTLRVIDTATEACSSAELPISWNQKGPKGDPGPRGLPGEPGPKGDRGAKGDPGDAGAQGPPGSPGPAGKDGISGQNGSAGPPGKDGADGKDGKDGKDGVSVTSAVEPAGLNCATGGSSFTSVSGTTYACNGAKGDKGDKGDPGLGNATIYHVSAQGDGTHVSGSAQMIGFLHPRTGVYVVSFNLNVYGCVKIATIGTIPTLLLSASFNGLAGEISTFNTLNTGAVSAVGVATHDSSGTLADQDFSLIVVC